MPILGALGVIDRIEKVMQEGLAPALQVLERDLRTNGTIEQVSPDAPVPSTSEYGRDEDPATDTVTSVITRCNSSEITNEPSNHGDLHWQHEIVVEVISVLSGEDTSQDMHSIVFRYGTAIVRLFAAERPCLELGAAAVSNDGFVSPLDAVDVTGSWFDEDFVLASDDARTSTVNRNGIKGFNILFDLANHIPNDRVHIVGMEIQVEGFCDDADAGKRTLTITVGTANPIIATAGSGNVTFGTGASDSIRTVGGASDLWGFTSVDVKAFAGVNNLKVRVETTETGGAQMFIDHVALKVYYKVFEPWDGAIVNNIGPVRYRNEFNEAGAFWIRSASVVMEVQRREIND